MDIVILSLCGEFKYDSKQYAELLSLKDCYNEFTIPKKRGGVRRLAAPCDQLKKFQVMLKDFLQEKEGLIEPAATGFVKYKSAVLNAASHKPKSAKYLLNIDLKDFFPSIT